MLLLPPLLLVLLPLLLLLLFSLLLFDFFKALLGICERNLDVPNIRLQKIFPVVEVFLDNGDRIFQRPGILIDVFS